MPMIVPVISSWMLITMSAPSPSRRIGILGLQGTTDLAIFPDNVFAQVHKYLVDVVSPPSATLIVRCLSPTLGKSKGLRSGNGSIFFEISLVTDEKYRNRRIVLDADDFLSEQGQLAKRGC